MAKNQKRTMEITMVVKDLATRAIKAMGRALKTAFLAPLRLVRTLSRAIFSMKGVFLGFSAALAGRAIVKSFGDFEAGLAKISTLLGEGEMSVRQFGLSLRDVSKKTGQTFEDLLQAGFDAVSNFGSQGVQEFVNVSARLATAGFTEVEKASNALIKAMLAYNVTTDEARRISDAIFKAMEGGSADIAGLSDGISRVADVAAAAGLSIENMLGMLSAMTRSAPNVEIAATRMVALLNIAIQSGIDLRGTKMIEFFEDLGTKSTQEVRRLLPNVRAFAGALGLSANNAENLRFVMDKMSDTFGATETALAKAVGTLNNQFSRFRQTVLDLFIQIGEAAKLFIERGLERLRAFVDDLANRGPQIRSVVGSIGKTFALVGKLAGQLLGSFDDLIAFVSNAVAASIKVSADIIAAGLPLMIRTVALVGKELGSALIRAFIGETSLELGRALQGGGIGALGAGALAKLVGIDTDSVKRMVQNLDDLEFAIKDVQRAATVAQAAGGRAAIGSSTTQGILGRLLFDPATQGRQAVEFASKAAFTVKEIEEVLRQAVKKRDEILFGLGDDPTKAARSRAQEEVRKELKSFWETDIATIMKDAIRVMRSGLSPEIQATIDAIGDIPKEAARSFAAATRQQLIVDAARQLNAFFGRLRNMGRREKRKMEQEFGPPLPAGGIPQQAGPRAPTFDLRRGGEPMIPETVRQFTLLERAGISAGHAIVGAFSGISDAIIDVATGISTTKDAFRQFGLSVLRTLGNIASELLVLSLIKAIFNPKKGSILGSIIGLADGGVLRGVKHLPVNKFADGGVARSPQIAIYGEGSNDEAFVPLKSGRIPVEVRGGGASMNFNIYAMDGKDVRRVLIEERRTIWGLMQNAMRGGDAGLRRTVRGG